jgi:hypothetical protein
MGAPIGKLPPAQCLMKCPLTALEVRAIGHKRAHGARLRLVSENIAAGPPSLRAFYRPPAQSIAPNFAPRAPSSRAAHGIVARPRLIHRPALHLSGAQSHEDFSLEFVPINGIFTRVVIAL